MEAMNVIRNEVLEKISKVDQEKVYIFHNRKQLNKWYKNTFNKKIEIWKLLDYK